MNKRREAFTVLEIMIVVGVIGLLAVIAVPRFMKARNSVQRNVCVNNLRQIDSAKSMHAIEAQKSNGDAVEPSALNDYLKKPFETMEEPASGAYEIEGVGENPLCTVGGEHVLPSGATP